MNTKHLNNPTGLFVPLVTPFYQGEFDEGSMKKLIMSLEGSVDGYIPCLSSGEGKKLSTEQWETVVRSVCQFAKKPVFAGVLRESEKEIIQLVFKANKLPCVGVVVPTLYDNDDKNLNYLKRVAAISNKNIILYNTEADPIKSIKTLKKLDAISKIVGIKESSMDMVFFKKLVLLKAKNELNMSVFQGMEHLLLPSKGCSGYVISLLNTKAKLCKIMYQKQNPSVNDEILTQFWGQNLGGNWYVTLKAILYQNQILRSAEEVNLTTKPQ